MDGSGSEGQVELDGVAVHHEQDARGTQADPSRRFPQAGADPAPSIEYLIKEDWDGFWEFLPHCRGGNIELFLSSILESLKEIAASLARLRSIVHTIWPEDATRPARIRTIVDGWFTYALVGALYETCARACKDALKKLETLSAYVEAPPSSHPDHVYAFRIFTAMRDDAGTTAGKFEAVEQVWNEVEAHRERGYTLALVMQEEIAREMKVSLPGRFRTLLRAIFRTKRSPPSSFDAASATSRMQEAHDAIVDLRCADFMFQRELLLHIDLWGQFSSAVAATPIADWKAVLIERREFWKVLQQTVGSGATKAFTVLNRDWGNLFAEVR